MIKNLVITGGGLKTFPFVGCFQYLEETNQLAPIRNYYAASIGSIYALMLCLKYTSKEIKHVLINFDIEGMFNDINIDNFLENYALCDVQKYRRFIELLITYKVIGKENMTLSELHKLTNKNLTCTSISLGKRKLMYINHETHPEMKVVDMILMSTAIPGMFPYINTGNDCYIDGAMIGNFPVDLIPKEDISATLCLRITVLFEEKTKAPTFDNVYEYFKYIYMTVAYSMEDTRGFSIINVPIEEKYNNDVVSISMSKEEMETAITCGFNVTKSHFNNHKHTVGLQRRNSL